MLPMLSIIVCSKYKKPDIKFVDNITKTVGIAFEIIFIDNSESTYSIFSAYNTGFERSKYPYLCFLHEDIIFHTQNWGENIIFHLQEPEVGIIGLAGDDLVTLIPARISMESANIIQSDRKGKKPTLKIQNPENFNETTRDAILLDGVMLCMSSKLMSQLKFDEQLTGFHGYDYDISIQSALAGYSNKVIYDVELEHFSRGKADQSFYRNLLIIFNKWEKSLPLIGKSISKKNVEKIKYVEKKQLYKLTKRLCRRGFSTKEVVDKISYYASLIDDREISKNLKARVLLNQLVCFPARLFK